MKTKQRDIRMLKNSLLLIGMVAGISLSSKGQGSLPLNGTVTDKIEVADTDEWWTLTTNADGKVQITFESTDHEWLTVILYDNDAVTKLVEGTSYGKVSISKEGLLPGTYKIKVHSGTVNNYNLSDSLIVPVQKNDNEYNNTPATAKNISQNKTSTGHIGYYYNHYRDSSDWYKFTTSDDGKIKLILTSHFAQWVTWKLYDGDGTTQLATGTSYGTNVHIEKEGLQAGTYYAVVTGTNPTPYTLTDSLLVPIQANDNENNDTKETAQSLSLNASTTGHIGYYYNGSSDDDDWYSVPVNEDGMLQFTLLNHFAQWLTFTLYDYNGTTILYNGTTYGTFNVKKDGLAAGTYYLKLHAGSATPYTLTNSLTVYNFKTDAEPNNYAIQAKTIAANGTFTGHSRFYYNNTRETPDWYKINYTGTNNISFIITQEAAKYDGSYHSYTFRLYKDTAAAYILSKVSAKGADTFNLAGLSQGYYYVKIYATNSTEWVAYSISNSFTQINTAQIALIKAKPGKSCNNSSLQFACTGSKAPYKVQLYRYGIAFGDSIMVNDTTTFIINNLPQGNYYATAYGDGATGNAYGASITTALVPKPTNTGETNITSTTVQLNWTNKSCITQNRVQYRIKGTTDWTTKKVTISSMMLTDLTAAFTYEWRVAAADTGVTASDVAFSGYTDTDTFTTAASIVSAAKSSSNMNAIASIYPNPASNFIYIQLRKAATITIHNASGQLIYTNEYAAGNASLDISRWKEGMYFIKMTYEDNTKGTQKIMIQR